MNIPPRADWGTYFAYCHEIEASFFESLLWQALLLVVVSCLD